MHKSFTPNAIPGALLTLFRFDRRRAIMHATREHACARRTRTSNGGILFFLVGASLGDSSDSQPLLWIGKVGFEMF